MPRQFDVSTKAGERVVKPLVVDALASLSTEAATRSCVTATRRPMSVPLDSEHLAGSYLVACHARRSTPHSCHQEQRPLVRASLLGMSPS